MAAVMLAVLATGWLPLSLQQIVPATLGLSGLCHVSQEDLRVLPSSGFTRAVLQPLTNTTFAGSQEPVPLAANLTSCLFQSYDPAFDALIGSTNRTIYQVGPTRSEPWAVESPAYLPGNGYSLPRIPSGSLGGLVSTSSCRLLTGPMSPLASTEYWFCLWMQRLTR